MSDNLIGADPPIYGTIAINPRLPHFGSGKTCCICGDPIPDNWTYMTAHSQVTGKLEIFHFACDREVILRIKASTF